MILRQFALRTLKYIFFLLLVLIASKDASATHNRAGEITYVQLSQFVYQATIITYTKTSSPADRPELELFWGDGTSSILPRASFQDQFGGPGSDIRRNVYVGTHTYPGPSTYTLYFEDPNRNGGVINIPNSINVPFYVESQLIISAFLGFNNSPVLLQPPIDAGVIGQPFVHNPNAYDPDGDSLSYHLIPCKGAGGVSIGGYTYPQASSFFKLDSITGDLQWDSPVLCGEYNIAILIREWRNGIQIGFVERDMQVTIVCNNPNVNEPPVVAIPSDTCITAGDLLSFLVTASDSDPTDLITLTGTGGPLEVSVSPAQFNQPITGNGSVSSQFDWQTDCAHVRLQPWQMVFKASDNDPFVNLADLASMRITVVAPAPQNLVVSPTGNNMSISWSASVCPQVSSYGVYRRAGFYGYVPSNCQTGVPSYTGYVRIATVQNTSYLDNNGGAGLAPGTDYCYMVVAEFPDGAESYASQEVCAVLEKQLPVLTNVSILGTDATTGQVYIAWSKPTDLDTLQFPSPHVYRVMRSTGIGTNIFQQVGLNNGGLDDTLFVDTGFNTRDFPYTYKIDLLFTSAGSLVEAGSSIPSSSVYLTATPSDEKVLLSWDEQVSWVNALYTIYRFNGVSFDSIGFSTSRSYTDSLLVNGQTYCYKIRSTGSYATSGYVNPIINFSQETCTSPIDNVPPCPPSVLLNQYDCPEGLATFQISPPSLGCYNDIAFYTVSYRPDLISDYQVLATLKDPFVTSWTNLDAAGVAGCYLFTATDSVGNTSQASLEICLEYCPSYELPNVFTPENDGLNDLFVPFPYQHVEAVEFIVFNRWGMRVFETADPDLMWNGKTENSGEDLPEGVYYYIGTVQERYLSGVKERELKGFIQLIR